MKPTWERGNVRLYLGDCREVLPHVGKVDACVTDPPYGISADKRQDARADKQHGRALAPSKRYATSDWDNLPASEESIVAMRAAATWCVFFGGNYFNLPPSRCWLVWDKMNGENHYADCELAWTNMDKPVRRICHRWHGFLRDGNDGDREHPTQKPVNVMRWAMDQCPDSASVCDPYMGSGTTGVAAVQTGRAFIGIEIDPTYFEIAVRRIDKAIDAGALFAPVPPAVREVGLFGGDSCA